MVSDRWPELVPKHLSVRRVHRQRRWIELEYHDVPAGGSTTVSSLITFSPLGIAPLSTAKTADAATSAPGSGNGYTVTVTNPNATAVTLNSVTDTLPAGFSYVSGSTTGVTTANPSVTGQTLTWAGPFSVPATGSVSLHFSVTVSSTPGDYFNNATADAGSATVVATGPTAKITVTSPQTATLHVIKHVVNDSGGSASAANFTLSVSGTSPSPASFPGAESPGTTVTLGAGSYSVSEIGPSGYTSSFSADCSGTIAAGETKTCTVTNDDVAAPTTGTLHVIKHVVNDSGGSASAANFTLSVSGTSPSPASFPGAESPGTTVTLGAGSYSVSEIGPSGYTSSFSADCSGTIAAGETKTCTVTNDDVAAPTTGTLHVIKHVVNDSGGSASAANFTLSVSGTSPSPASFPGAESLGTTVTLGAGSYSVSEIGPSGYTSSFSADCSGTIAAGETKTCTVTNDDVAPPPVGDEGCSHGYWKTHESAWVSTGYSPTQTVGSVFSGAGSLDSSSLREALKFGGGSSITGAKQILLRQAVAALLNAAHPGVAYPRTTDQVIASVDSALASDDRTTILELASALDADNNLGCPLS